MLLFVFLTFLCTLVTAAPFHRLPIRDDGTAAWLDDSSPTLYPSDSWDHDRLNVDNLTPKDSHVLYYTDSGSYDPSVEHLFATIETNYHYLAVSTSHTKYIHSISCLDGDSLSLVITFNDQKAYDHVKSHWTLADGHQWVLVTHTSGCFTSKNGQNTFWLVSQVSYEGDDGSLKVKLCVEEIAIGHCVSEIEVTWGTHQPIVPGAGGQVGPGNGGSPHSSTPSKPSSGPSPGPGPSGGPTPGSKPSSVPGPSVISSSSSKPSDSSTPPNQNTTDCGAYPGATYLGFPTAPCGEDFDIKLDAAIGYYPFDAEFSSDLASFAPGLDTYAVEEYQDDSTDLSRRNRVIRTLGKRGLFKKLKKAFNKVVNVVKTKVVPVISKAITVAKKIQAVAVKVIDTVKAAIRALDNLGGTYGPKTFSLKEGPPKDSPSPWGRQSLIYKTSSSSSSSVESELQSSSSSSSYSIGLWCVDCGVESKAVVLGSARFSLITGQVKTAFVQVSGSFGFNVALGLDAVATYSTSYRKTLLSLPIPGTSFVIPGVLIFGGQASIGVSAFANARAAGRILVGGNVGIPNYVARLDAVNTGSSGVSGFSPVLKQTFDAQGSLDIDAGFGIPIEVGFGIALPAIPTFGPKVIGLRDTPEFVANARGVYDNGWQTINGCTGIPWRVDFHNRLDADAFGKIYPLARQDKIGLFNGCINLSSGSSSSSRRSSSYSSRTSSAPSAIRTYSDYSSYSSAYSPSSSGYLPSNYSSYSSDYSSYSSDHSYSSDYSSYSSDYSSYSSAYSSYPSDYSSYYSSAPSYSSIYTSDIGAASASVDSSYSSYSSAPSSTPSEAIDRRVNSRFLRRQDSINTTSIAPDALAFLEDDAQFVAEVNAELLAIAIQQEADLNPSSPDFDGAQYTAIFDNSGTYGLVGDESGVLRFVDKDTANALPWATFDAITVSDAQDRVLHYYPAQIAKFGVSRFRIQDVDHLPLGSEISSLIPITTDENTSSKGTYVPVNTAADAFYPIVCNLAGQRYSKMFLATDPDEGVKSLLKPELRFILTGGVVQDCGVVQLVSSQSAGYGL